MIICYLFRKLSEIFAKIRNKLIMDKSNTQFFVILTSIDTYVHIAIFCMLQNLNDEY